MELGTSDNYWEASGGNDAGAGYWNLINSRDELSRAEEFDGAAFSVRCVKNAMPDVKMVKPASAQEPAPASDAGAASADAASVDAAGAPAQGAAP